MASAVIHDKDSEVLGKLQGSSSNQTQREISVDNTNSSNTSTFLIDPSLLFPTAKSKKFVSATQLRWASRPHAKPAEEVPLPVISQAAAGVKLDSAEPNNGYNTSASDASATKEDSEQLYGSGKVSRKKQQSAVDTSNSRADGNTDKAGDLVQSFRDMIIAKNSTYVSKYVKAEKSMDSRGSRRVKVIKLTKQNSSSSYDSAGQHSVNSEAESTFDAPLPHINTRHLAAFVPIFARPTAFASPSFHRQMDREQIGTYLFDPKIIAANGSAVRLPLSMQNMSRRGVKTKDPRADSKNGNTVIMYANLMTDSSSASLKSEAEVGVSVKSGEELEGDRIENTSLGKRKAKKWHRLGCYGCNTDAQKARAVIHRLAVLDSQGAITIHEYTDLIGDSKTVDLDAPQLIMGRMKTDPNRNKSTIRIRKDLTCMQWVVETDDKRIIRIAKRRKRKSGAVDDNTRGTKDEVNSASSVSYSMSKSSFSDAKSVATASRHFTFRDLIR